MSVRGTALHYHSAHMADCRVKVVHLREESMETHAVMAQPVQAGAAVARGARLPGRRARRGLAVGGRGRREQRRGLIVAPRRRVPDLADPQVPRFLVALGRTHELGRKGEIAGHGGAGCGLRAGAAPHGRPAIPRRSSLGYYPISVFGSRGIHRTAEVTS